MEATSSHLIGKTVGFEDENEDVAWKGTITKVAGNKVHVEGDEHVSGWYELSTLQIQD